MSTHPIAIVRRFFTWLFLFGSIIAAAFNLWLGINGSWPGLVATGLLAVLAGKCLRSLWRDSERRQSR